jgi:hypothetical protein
MHGNVLDAKEADGTTPDVDATSPVRFTCIVYPLRPK